MMEINCMMDDKKVFIRKVMLELEFELNLKHEYSTNKRGAKDGDERGALRRHSK